MAPPIVHSVDQLVPNLQGRRLVLIDGRNWVGKSTLARALAERLPAAHVEVDDLLLEDPNARPNSYPEAVDMEALLSRVEECGNQAVLLDCICVRDVAKRAGIRYDAHVLVTSIDPAEARFDAGQRVRDPEVGFVVDDALFDDRVSLGRLFKEVEEDPHPMNTFNAMSIVRYFKLRRPQDTATAIFVAARGSE